MLRFRIEQEKQIKYSEHSASAAADSRLHRRGADALRNTDSGRLLSEQPVDMGSGITVTRIGKIGGEVVMKYAFCKSIFNCFLYATRQP